MGHTVDLIATDGHHLSAYVTEPAGGPRGGIVIIQEIFGVTGHIRAVTDQYAAAGYLAVAPALFDRVERNVDVAYSDVGRARGYVKATNTDAVMLDLAAAVERVRPAGRVGVVGFCWGGTIAFLAGARLDIDAAVAYYGGGIDGHLVEKPLVPTLFHFGENDAHIPQTSVEKIKSAIPDGTYYLYPAGHGFNCTDRASFDASCAKLALQRSLDFLSVNVG